MYILLFYRFYSSTYLLLAELFFTIHYYYSTFALIINRTGCLYLLKETIINFELYPKVSGVKDITNSDDSSSFKGFLSHRGTVHPQEVLIFSIIRRSGVLFVYLNLAL